MVVNHNPSAAFAQRQQNWNTRGMEGNIERLSSGERINRAGDDASGLAVTEKMRGQIRGLQRAEKNAADGVSMIQTAEGFLQNSQDILQRLRELAVQASNGIYTDEDRTQIQVEVSQLVGEINRIASHAEFNGLSLLTGRFAPDTGENLVTASMHLHIGANMDQRMQIHIGTMTAQGLGLQGTDGLPHTATFLSLSSPDQANAAIGTIDQALMTVNKQRADLGAYQNRLEFARRGLDVGAENLAAAESRIRDTDMAEEMVEFTRNQILSQSSTSMLAQANMLPQNVLELLQ